MKPTVYVTQETEYDFLPAEAFGEIKFITSHDINNVRGSLHNEELIRRIRMRLHAFDPARDFVVITGSPYVAAVVFLILGNRGITEVNLLRWSNRDRVYIPLTVKLPPTREE